MLAPLALAGATLGLAANPAQAITLFAGPYAPANWTQSIGGDGSIDTNGAPGSIILNGSDIDSGPQNVDFTITAPAAGIISFDFSYVTNEYVAGFDPFGYLINGSFTELTEGSLGNQSGSFDFWVLQGDVFGFRQGSAGTSNGRGSTTISNFNGPKPAPPSSVPGPLPLLGAGAAWGWSRRLRQRIATPLITASRS